MTQSSSENIGDKSLYTVSKMDREKLLDKPLKLALEGGISAYGYLG
jgi:hypothetical protein